MTKAQALQRLHMLTEAIENCPFETIIDAQPNRRASATGDCPSIQISWGDFTRTFSRARSRYSEGYQFLETEAGGVVWHTCRELHLPEREPHEVGS